MYFLVKCPIIFLLISISFGDNDFLNEEKRTINVRSNDYANLTYPGGSEFTGREGKTFNHNMNCHSVGTNISNILTKLLKQKKKHESSLFTHFYIRNRKNSHRVKVTIDDKFKLRRTDFNISLKTVVIVHGFVSDADEDWIQEMGNAFLLWGDVNVVAVDWGEGSNTWNYVEATVHTQKVGSLIAKFFVHVANSTINSRGPSESEWGAIHFVGHSLGAHICGFAANLIKKSSIKWKIERITGLDPAHPCFQNVDSSMYLDKSDAPFVDVIHTNGRYLPKFGFGMPQPIGHVDFYPNGGTVQPECVSTNLFSKLKLQPISQKIKQAICSHSQACTYFIASINASVSKKCKFWAHRWNFSHRHINETIMNEKCNVNNCSEMGINAASYTHRGIFFSFTSATMPHCSIQQSDKEKAFKIFSEESETLVEKLKLGEMIKGIRFV